MQMIISYISLSTYKICFYNFILHPKMCSRWTVGRCFRQGGNETRMYLLSGCEHEENVEAGNRWAKKAVIAGNPCEKTDVIRRWEFSIQIASQNTLLSSSLLQRSAAIGRMNPRCLNGSI